MIRFNRPIALILGTLLVFSSVLDAKDRSAKGVKLNYKSLNAKAMKEYSVPVHPGRKDSTPFWNGFSYRFIYAPAFDFAEVPGAANYLFTVRQAEHDNMTETMDYIGNGYRNFTAEEAAPGPGPYKEWSFKADSPQSALSPVWSKIPVGRTEVVVEGLDKSGKVIGELFGHPEGTDPEDETMDTFSPCWMLNLNYTGKGSIFSTLNCSFKGSSIL